jgi:predicted membrane channel-forming protein YqfA (hemolysin III family)
MDQCSSREDGFSNCTITIVESNFDYLGIFITVSVFALFLGLIFIIIKQRHKFEGSKKRFFLAIVLYFVAGMSAILSFSALMYAIHLVEFPDICAGSQKVAITFSDVASDWDYHQARCERWEEAWLRFFIFISLLGFSVFALKKVLKIKEFKQPEILESE